MFHAALHAATPNASISPASLDFGSQWIGGASGGQTVSVTNNGAQSIVVTSFSFTNPVFHWTDGQTQTILAGASAIYHIRFAPTAPGTYTGQFLVNIRGLASPLSASLTGTATLSAASPSPSATSLTYSSVPLGNTSAGQVLTLQNNGASKVTLRSYTTIPPQFAVSSVKLPQTIQPGKSFSLTVSFTPAAAGTVHGLLHLGYTETKPTSVSLVGSAVAPTGLAVTSFPTLPTAVQGAAYQGVLTSSLGTPPYAWTLAAGSTLPSGLTLQSSGVISGTVVSGVAAGSYSATVQVTDSGAPPITATRVITIPVVLPTGAACGNIFLNMSGTTQPIVPLDQLGSQLYQGYPGGLYPGGMNIMPDAHQAAGIALAQSIQPLDANGVPSTTGKYVLLGMGTSAAKYEFDQFQTYLTPYPSLNPNLVIVEGAQGTETMLQLTTSLGAGLWNNILNFALPQAGVTAQQVVAVWLEGEDLAVASFPGGSQTLQSEFEGIGRSLLQYFPNLKILYFAPRIYAGYSNGISNHNPEPEAYEQGFAIQWAIADQLNGNPSVNFDQQAGAVMAPWFGWSSYYWGNGLIPRTDGLTWSCADFKPDGYHPETPGDLKVISALLEFLVTDPTASPWFLAHQ